VAVVEHLDPLQTGGVRPDESQEVAGELAAGVEALRFLDEEDAVNVEGLDPGRPVGGMRRAIQQKFPLRDSLCRICPASWSRIAASFAAASPGWTILAGSAQTLSAITETASFSPLRSKMIPRSGGTCRVLTCWRSASDFRVLPDRI
jgi:hypothetical protein